MADFADTLVRLKGAWMAGRTAAPLCPQDWQTAAGGSEAALAALAGQALQITQRPAAPPAR